MPGVPSLWPPGIPRDLSPCSVAEGRWLPAGCAPAGRAPGSAPARASSAGAAGWSRAAAQAAAQCHPVTACDLRGDSGAQLRWLCCKGFEQPGRPKAREDVGKPTEPAVLLLRDGSAAGARLRRGGSAAGAGVSPEWPHSGAAEAESGAGWDCSSSHFGADPGEEGMAQDELLSVGRMCLCIGECRRAPASAWLVPGGQGCRRGSELLSLCQAGAGLEGTPCVKVSRVVAQVC